MSESESVTALLALNTYEVDERAHIVVDPTICARCTTRPCLRICSASCFRETGGEVSFDHAGCLECGTCRVVCRELGAGGVVDWRYPEGTFGVSYRLG